MRLLLVLTLCIFFAVQLEASPCNKADTEDAPKECNDTEYHSYIECMRKRVKRSLDCENAVQEPCNNCEDSCQQCDCDYCAVNACHQTCNNCCPNNPPCTTHRCCHKTCHARCNSSKCRNECRRTCMEKVIGVNGTNSINITTGEKVHHNITTIINLHNIVNNTNIIDIPVQINNTNVNNITLSEVESSYLNENVSIVSNSSSLKEACCHVVSPRQCVPTDKAPFVRCFHIRRKLCGPFCKAPIVHEQPHQVCDQTATSTSCHQQLIYIPQPQPRCAYQAAWPYVSCGGQQQQQPFCGGCYDHYTSPFPQLPPPGCSPGCYDDGYGVGPYYRQGPFYRPGYANVPSCYQTGFCGFYGNGGYGAGYGSNFGPVYGPGYGGGYGGGYGNPYGGYGNPYGGYGNPYGGFGYPPPAYGGGGFPGYPGFPGLGYPPNTYENNVHIETDPSNVVPRVKDEAGNSSDNKVEVQEPPPSSYYPVPMVPQYSASGYPYPYAPQHPTYNLPPEVDIQATITHPEKDSRYAQITISKEHDKREIGSGEKTTVETSTAKMEPKTE